MQEDLATELLRDSIIPWIDSMAYANKKKVTRDVYVLHGESDISKFVIYWSEGDPLNGPTGLARTVVLLAQREGIPTYHLGDPIQLANFLDIYLDGDTVYCCLSLKILKILKNRKNSCLTYRILVLYSS